MLDGHLARHARDAVEAECRDRCSRVCAVGGNDLVPERQHGRHRLERAGRRHRVADHRLRRADQQAVPRRRPRAAPAPRSGRSAASPCRARSRTRPTAGAMPACAQCRAHRPRHPLAFRVRRGDVKGVGRSCRSPPAPRRSAPRGPGRARRSPARRTRRLRRSTCRDDRDRTDGTARDRGASSVLNPMKQIRVSASTPPASAIGTTPSRTRSAAIARDDGAGAAGCHDRLARSADAQDAADHVDVGRRESTRRARASAARRRRAPAASTTPRPPAFRRRPRPRSARCPRAPPRADSGVVEGLARGREGEPIGPRPPGRAAERSRAPRRRSGSESPRCRSG